MSDTTPCATPSALALNWYYARTPDLVAEVLATRLRACEVREHLGIPAGRVLRLSSGAGDLPDVMWDCPFDGVAGHDADMAVRAASADFEAVRARMRGLTRRFERVLYSLGGSDLATLPLDRDRLRSYQRWLHVEDTGKRTPWEGEPPPGARRRLGSEATLPDWIVEAWGADQLRARPLLPGLRVEIVDSTWERIR
jgi:hypothetical protein